MEHRKFDLRNNYELSEVLKTTYPRIMNHSWDQLSLRTMRKMYAAGVPFNYLEASWEDYQAEDRTSLSKIKEFASTIRLRSDAGGGVILSGANGVGKSFLSYMCAIHSIRMLRLDVVCFSIWEYLDKRSCQYITPDPFNELLGLIDRAKVVVLDNLSKESEKIIWKPEDLFEVVERVTTGRRNRCFIINTGLSKADFERQSGGSAFSRLQSFDKIPIRNADFRGKQVDINIVSKYRVTEQITPSCYKPSMLVADKKARLNIPEACEYCAYKTRLTLCDLRTKGKWKTDDRTEGPIVHLQPTDNSGTSTEKGNET